MSDFFTRGFTCPRCGWTSYHPQDVREGYCGHCRDWTAQRTGYSEVRDRS